MLAMTPPLPNPKYATIVVGPPIKKRLGEMGLSEMQLGQILPNPLNWPYEIWINIRHNPVIPVNYITRQRNRK